MAPGFTCWAHASRSPGLFHPQASTFKMMCITTGAVITSYSIHYTKLYEGAAFDSSLALFFLDTAVNFFAVDSNFFRGCDAQGRKMYTLWDIYPHADFVTYPSLYEGFGNALLEAFYFKKPIMTNRYSIYVP